MSFQLCIIKLSGTESGSCSWLLRNSAAGMQQHQGDTWIKGSKGTELPEAGDFTPTRGQTTAASSSAPERPLTTGTAGLMTLKATADGVGAKKGGRRKRAALPGLAALQCCWLSPTSCPHTSSAHHREPPSSSLPLTHAGTPSSPLQNLLTAFRTRSEQLHTIHDHTGLTWTHTVCPPQLSTQHTNPGIMLITKSSVPATSSSLKIKAVVQETWKRL